MLFGLLQLRREVNQDEPRDSRWRQCGKREVIPARCPARVGSTVSPHTVTESESLFIRAVAHWGPNMRVYIDSSWTPQITYKAGDVIEDAKLAEYLPIGAIYADARGDVWHVTHDSKGWLDFSAAPLTVIHVPEGEV